MRPLAVTAVVAVLAVSACGSESHVQSGPAPKLPHAVAISLAARSDVLAAALRSGDACGARIQMHGLERQTRLAIEAGRVPAAFRLRLLTAEQQLASRLPACVPPAPPPPPPPAPDEQHGKKKHGKHGKHGNGEGD